MTGLLKSSMAAEKKYLDLIRKYIHINMGIYVSDRKLFSLQSKLEKLLSSHGIDDLKTLYKSLEAGDRETRHFLVEAVTVNYTYFFREPEHLAYIANDILSRQIKNITIWCSAASTGEEVYSLIIILLEKGILDFKIIASDVDRSVLKKMKKGIYSQDRMEKVELPILKKYFVKDLDGRNYRIRDNCKKHILAKQLNLVHNLHFTQKFQYILCRNVLIYFDHNTRKKVIQTLLYNLKPDGNLFMGQSESVMGMEKSVQQIGSSVYARRE